MFLARLLIFVFVLSNDSIFTLADNFPNPYPYPYFHDNNNPLYYYRCFDHNLPNPHPVPPPLPKTQKFVLAFGRGNTIATVVIIVLTLLNIVVFKLRQLQEENSDDDKINVSSSLPSEQLCRRFSLGEILSATHNFDESLVIGKGGFGKVYKGVIDSGTVAIKRLSSMSKQGAPEFWTEIAMLSKCRHSHLVSLIGYCDNYYELVLVYEYMVNGTLADHLYKLARKGNNGSPLSWNQRLKICIGAARGLDYLHTGTGIKHRIIHRDVKSTNILLDENWAAKISDFGMSKTAPANQSCTYVSTLVKGTFGYIDPNYSLTRRLTRKSDVYGFGVVLFEVLCGRPPVDLSLHEDQWGLTGWVQNCIKEGIVDQIIDPNLRGEVFSNCLAAYVQIANQCLHNHPKKRPTMAEVVGWLEFALGLLENRDSSVVEEEIFNISRPYDSQEHTESSRDQEVINVDNVEHHKEKVIGIKRLGADGKHSPKKHIKRMKFTNKMRSFFLNTARLISVGRDAKTSKNKQSDDYRGVKVELTKQMLPAGEIVIPNLKIFTFAELKIATSNFRQDRLLGEGGFGTVFKGWVDGKTYAPSKVGIGMAVAVKKYNPEGFRGYKEWRSEVELLGRYSHPNLVKLLGYCGEEKEILFVYEYMQNGSLENHLFRKGTKQLSWVTRLKIAVGSARGIVFLHTGAETQIIYRDVKASNILLDVDFNAKLSDFGLAKSGPVADRTHVSTRVMGTYGYVAPEYLATGHLTQKSDVYGFGVVLLEILTGLRALDLNRPSGQHNLVDWVKPFLPDKRKLKRIVDLQLLEHDYPPKGAFLLAALTLKCLEVEPRKRPSMKEVLETLEQINAVTKDNSTASDK